MRQVKSSGGTTLTLRIDVTERTGEKNRRTSQAEMKWNSIITSRVL
jgi:hypothetical protein